MPRKKAQTKTSAGTLKLPVTLEIKAHIGPASPHVLNLRPASHHSPPQNSFPGKTVSLEQHAAAFDERLQEVPDLLKARTDALADFWKEEKRQWQETATSSFKALLDWGANTRDRLQEKRASRKLARRNWSARQLKLRSSPHNVNSPLFSLRHSTFFHFAVLLIILTIPLQALAVYRALEQTQAAAFTSWNTANQSFLQVLRSAQEGKLEETFSALGELRKHLRSLSYLVNRTGPLLKIMPEDLQSAAPLLNIAATAAEGAENLLGEALKIKNGVSAWSALFAGAEGMLINVNQKVSAALLQKPQDPLFIFIQSRVRSAKDIATLLRALSGEDESRHFLFIFQNPRELRATGGFAGSFALVTIKDGRLEKIEAPPGGTYAVQDQLKLTRISPEQLHLINPRFELQDANWWPNFPASAQKIAEFFESADGPTLDGVIAITAYVGEELLKITGPLQGPEVEINAQNFIDVLQETIARDRLADKKAPKKIITALLPSLLEALRDAANNNPKALAELILNGLTTKEIQIWTRLEEAQGALSRLHWSGELTKTTGDYLAVITSNVGGGKTDATVEETITHEVYAESDGKLKETLRIRRMHKGIQGDPFTGERNVAYLRVYVPDNARFLQASGFSSLPPGSLETPENQLLPDPQVRLGEINSTIDNESGTKIWTESGKTVFGNFLIVKAGETAEAVIRYEVPLTVQGSTIPYTLTVDRQAGKRVQFESHLALNENLRLISGTPKVDFSPEGWHFSLPLKKNLVASVILQRL